MSHQKQRRLGSALLAISLLLASCTSADSDQAVDSESSTTGEQATPAGDSGRTDSSDDGDERPDEDSDAQETSASKPTEENEDEDKDKDEGGADDGDTEDGATDGAKPGKTDRGTTSTALEVTTESTTTKSAPKAGTINKNGSRTGAGSGSGVSDDNKNSSTRSTAPSSTSRRPRYSIPSTPAKNDSTEKPKANSPKKSDENNTSSSQSTSPTKPKTADDTQTTSAPDVSKPAVTSKPAATSKPVTTSKPEVTSKPVVTEKPAEPIPPQPEAPSNGKTVWGYDASAPSSAWKRLGVGTVYSDPVYNTSIRRVTSADGTRFNRNTYSRRQAENANGSMFMSYHGNAAYHIYTVANGSEVARLSINPDAEPQWHPSNPNIIRHIAGANSYTGELKLYETDVNTNNTREIADLTKRLQAAIPGAAYMIDRAEGSPSMNGNRYAWIVYNSSEQPIGLASYDLGSDTVLGTTSLRSTKIDWVGMSPKGNYVVAGYLDGTTVYNADLTNMRQLTEATEHSDIALDKSGRETYVYIDFESSSPTNGWLTAIDMATLQRTKIFDIYNNANSSVHVSGKGFNKPGWVVVSTYNCKVPGAWTCDKVMAVEIAAQGRVLNLAHTYNCGDNYWTETHAVVNRSFTRVYYNSDAGSCGIDAEVYRLDVPRFD